MKFQAKFSFFPPLYYGEKINKKFNRKIKSAAKHHLSPLYFYGDYKHEIKTKLRIFGCKNTHTLNILNTSKQYRKVTIKTY